MDFIGIALIIAVVVIAVHFVHVNGKKEGMNKGIAEGRMQILEENLKRLDVEKRYVEAVNAQHG